MNMNSLNTKLEGALGQLARQLFTYRSVGMNSATQSRAEMNDQAKALADLVNTWRSTLAGASAQAMPALLQKMKSELQAAMVNAHSARKADAGTLDNIIASAIKQVEQLEKPAQKLAQTAKPQPVRQLNIGAARPNTEAQRERRRAEMIQLGIAKKTAHDAIHSMVLEQDAKNAKQASKVNAPATNPIEQMLNDQLANKGTAYGAIDTGLLEKKIEHCVGTLAQFAADLNKFKTSDPSTAQKIKSLAAQVAEWRREVGEAKQDIHSYGEKHVDAALNKLQSSIKQCLSDQDAIFGKGKKISGIYEHAAQMTTATQQAKQQVTQDQEQKNTGGPPRPSFGKR